jgi:branched-subunit amino acid transport protein
VSWPAILVLAAGAYACKAAGVMLLGPRATSRLALRAVALLPASLLAALVVVQTFGADRRLVVDARAAGVAVAAVLAWRRAPFVAVVVAGATVTAVLRAVA